MLNGNPVYVFWSGNGKPDTISKKWANVYVTPVFEAAGIERNGNMVSHRLRDTFAVDLLQKGVPAGGSVQAARARIHQDHGKKLCEMGEGTAGPARCACDRDLELGVPGQNWITASRKADCF